MSNLKCELCNKEFSNKNNYNKHKTRKTPCVKEITNIKIPTIITAERAPVLPNSNVDANALGISATMPEKIISDIPLPTPLNVICSPNHIKKVVPATKETTVVNLKVIPGSTTRFPAFSNPTETP